jgi:hypothetical protein
MQFAVGQGESSVFRMSGTLEADVKGGALATHARQPPSALTGNSLCYAESSSDRLRDEGVTKDGDIEVGQFSRLRTYRGQKQIQRCKK